MNSELERNIKVSVVGRVVLVSAQMNLLCGGIDDLVYCLHREIPCHVFHYGL